MSIRIILIDNFSGGKTLKLLIYILVKVSPPGIKIQKETLSHGCIGSNQWWKHTQTNQLWQRPIHAYLDPGRTECGRWHSAVTMTAGPGSCGDSRHEGWAPSALTRSASEHSCTSPAAENVTEYCQQCNIWKWLDTGLQATRINHEVYIIVVT